MTVCTIEGCDDPARSRSWCRKHHQRWQRTGDPLGMSFAYLTVDAEPLCRHIDRHATSHGRDPSEHVRALCGESTARSVLRARARGTFTVAFADRLAIDVLGMTLDEIYGPDWDEVAA